MRVARDKGAALPNGVLVDKDGKPSTDPNDLYGGGALLPAAAHKGYALGFMVEVLGMAVTGAFEPENASKQGATSGSFFMAIDPSVFCGFDVYARAVEQISERMKSVPAGAGLRRGAATGRAGAAHAGGAVEGDQPAVGDVERHRGGCSIGGRGGSGGLVAVAFAEEGLMADAADRIAVSLTVNGRSAERVVEPRRSLADFLRHDLGLTGTHVGCEHGVCGACTVLVDGQAARSCLLLAAQLQGAAVTTIEGLTPAEGLSPLQAAFRAEHGLQCGFCTPGMIVVSTELLAENPNPSEDEIREALSGNLCMCTGYVNVVRAVRSAAETMAGRGAARGVLEDPANAGEQGNGEGESRSRGGGSGRR